MTWLDGQCGPIRGIPRILDLPGTLFLIRRYFTVKWCDDDCAEIYNIRIPFKEDIDIVGFGLEPGDTIVTIKNK